ncbi:MAG: DUF86 domain-containing protein [Bacilli bacterium]|nr:DUF86 domain-containing protein [Bacilli bacterium]
MLTVPDKGLLLSMIAHCDRIEEKIKGVTKEEFSENQDIKEIVCFHLLQIGELAGKYGKEFLKDYSGVPWGKMRGMRNRIVHGYGTIKVERVWATANKDIKPLREYCERILRENK